MPSLICKYTEVILPLSSYSLVQIILFIFQHQHQRWLTMTVY